MRGGHQILPRYSAAVLWPRSTISILGMKRMFSKMDRSPTLEDRNSNVRFGSKAVMCGAQGHVCFTPESGHVRRNYGCPLWAKSGHSHLLVKTACGSDLRGAHRLSHAEEDHDTLSAAAR